MTTTIPYNGTSRVDFMHYLCMLHNIVNERLKKVELHMIFSNNSIAAKFMRDGEVIVDVLLPLKKVLRGTAPMETDNLYIINKMGCASSDSSNVNLPRD